MITELVFLQVIQPSLEGLKSFNWKRTANKLCDALVSYLR